MKFSEDDGNQTDLMVILADNSKVTRGMRIKRAPDLIVEILSPDTGSTDFGWKKEMAETYGVSEYWVVDPVFPIVFAV